MGWLTDAINVTKRNALPIAASIANPFGLAATVGAAAADEIGGAGTAANIASLGGKGRAEKQKTALAGQQSDIGEIMADLSTQREKDLATIDDTLDPFTRDAKGDLDEYRNQDKLDLSKYGFDEAPDFQQTGIKTANDYLDPSLQFQITKANEALQGSAANRGELFSGATGNAISENTRGMAETGYTNAQQMANQQNAQGWTQQHQTWADRIAADRAAKTQGADMETGQYNAQNQLLGNLANMGGNAVTNRLQSTLNTRQGYNANLTNAALAKSGLKAQAGAVDDSVLGNVMAALPSWLQMGGSVAKAAG